MQNETLNSTPPQVGAGRLLSSMRGSLASSQPPQTIRRSIRDDQIYVLTFDRPGSGANLFDRSRSMRT